MPMTDCTIFEHKSQDQTTLLKFISVLNQWGYTKTPLVHKTLGVTYGFVSVPLSPDCISKLSSPVIKYTQEFWPKHQGIITSVVIYTYIYRERETSTVWGGVYVYRYVCYYYNCICREK